MEMSRSNKIFLSFVVFVSCFIVFSMRRPELLNNPQFWAEDGSVWYAQAFNLGAFQSIILPQNGYYQTISKLIAAASLYFPLYAAPLFFNIMGLALRSLLIVYILSSRLKEHSITGRMILSLYIVIMPNIDEVHANITNTHWYLSIWLFMIIISDDAKGIYWKTHDTIILILSGLSGPFIVFLAPVMFMKITKNIKSWRPSNVFECISKNINSNTLIFTALCVIQISTILISSNDSK